MRIYDNYKYMLGLITFAAVLYMIVLNIQGILGVITSFYKSIIPLVGGIFIAFILDIIVHRYENSFFSKTKNKYLLAIKRPFCTVIGLISVVFIIGFVLYMAIPQTIHSITLALNNLPTLYGQLVDWNEAMSHEYPIVNRLMTDMHISNQSAVEQLVSYLSSWVGGIVSTFSNVLYFLMNLVIAFVFSIYLLLNKEQLIRESKEFVRAYFSDKYLNHGVYAVKIINETFSNFFIGQFFDAVILGILVFSGMKIFGLPYAINIACVVGLTALVPLLGAYLGASIGVIMLLVENPMNALAFLIILLVMQQLENNLIYPKIVGNSIGLPGIWVFAAIVVGGNLYGVIGMLLGVPLMATGYKILRLDVRQRLDVKQNLTEKSEN